MNLTIVSKMKTVWAKLTECPQSQMTKINEMWSLFAELQRFNMTLFWHQHSVVVSLCSRIRFRAGRVKALAGASSNFNLLSHFRCAMAKFINKISFLGRFDDLEFSASSTVEAETLTSFRSVPRGRSDLKFWG